MVSKRQQTFSLKTCIEKYGLEEGLVKFNERQIKWQKTLYKNGKLKSGYSEVSQELFYKLIEDVEINESNYFLFAKNFSQKAIYILNCWIKPRIKKTKRMRRILKFMNF